jgi:hypothetical protein
MFFNKDSAIQKCFQKTLHSLQVKKFGSLSAVRTPISTKYHPFGRRVISSGRPSVQSTSRPDDVSYCPDALLSKASSVRTTRTFRPDLPLCREVSNCSNLHLFGCFNSLSGRLLVFDKLQDFFPKHNYGKITATVQTKTIPVRTRSSIRQVSQFKSRRSDDDPHGPDACVSDMEIVCIKLTVRTIIPLVRKCEAFI